jgi:flagellar protein FlbD
MIELTRLNGTTFFINPDHIWLVEQTPDTVLTMINGERLMVVEKAIEVTDKFYQFRLSLLNKKNWV